MQKDEIQPSKPLRQLLATPGRNVFAVNTPIVKTKKEARIRRATWALFNRAEALRLWWRLILPIVVGA
jgi:hypothetical protein